MQRAQEPARALSDACGLYSLSYLDVEPHRKRGFAEWIHGYQFLLLGDNEPAGRNGKAYASDFCNSAGDFNFDREFQEFHGYVYPYLQIGSETPHIN